MKAKNKKKKANPPVIYFPMGLLSVSDAVSASMSIPAPNKNTIALCKKNEPLILILSYKLGSGSGNLGVALSPTIKALNSIHKVNGKVYNSYSAPAYGPYFPFEFTPGPNGCCCRHENSMKFLNQLHDNFTRSFKKQKECVFRF